MNETVTLEQLRAYLAATGWQQRQPYGRYTDRWHHPSYSDYPDDAMVMALPENALRSLTLYVGTSAYAGATRLGGVSGPRVRVKAKPSVGFAEP